MSLDSVGVEDFRCIERADLALHDRCNLISGENASGKTSLLEAIFVLGRGRSFRTAKAETLIRSGSAAFQLTARVRTDGSARPLGLRLGKEGIEARYSGRPISGLAELATILPAQAIDPEVHRLIEGGPQERRRFLDWGVFHVEPAFFPTWQRYSRALRQRNAALRARATAQEIQMWDGELVAAAEILDQFRCAYLAQLLPVLLGYVSELTDLEGLQWEYRPGWSRKLDYGHCLNEALEGDRRQGFTRLGPHRADLIPTLDGEPAQERVSRGQQKQIAIALMLAQAAVYQQRSGQTCLFLIDDLASELDSIHRSRVLRHLCELQVQIFLTAIESDAIEAQLWPEHRRFHVEHGRVEE